MLAVIGGTGLYELPGMEIEDRSLEATPFGEPSAAVLHGRLHGRQLLFLARHGSGHRLLPHEVNYRANVFALKRAGATQVLGFSAVGSLVEDIAPGEFALPTQYVDVTRGRREASFFGAGVAAHVSTAEPVSAAMGDWIAAAAEALSIPLHRSAVYACVDGPRFGTRAESRLLRQWGCDLVGMTNVPEAFLAREAQMGYATVAIVTDYDCWMDDPSKHASVTAILERYGESLAEARRLLAALLETSPAAVEPETRTALASAVLTADAALSDAQREWLAVLRA